MINATLRSLFKTMIFPFKMELKFLMKSMMLHVSRWRCRVYPEEHSKNYKQRKFFQ